MTQMTWTGQKLTHQVSSICEWCEVVIFSVIIFDFLTNLIASVLLWLHWPSRMNIDFSLLAHIGNNLLNVPGMLQRMLASIHPSRRTCISHCPWYRCYLFEGQVSSPKSCGLTCPNYHYEFIGTCRRSYYIADKALTGALWSNIHVNCYSISN